MWRDRVIVAFALALVGFVLLMWALALTSCGEEEPVVSSTVTAPIPPLEYAIIALPYPKAVVKELFETEKDGPMMSCAELCRKYGPPTTKTGDSVMLVPCYSLLEER